MSLRVGLVGTGWVGLARHLPSLRSHPGAEVVAVLDRRPERAAAVAREHRIPAWDGELEAFLARDLDVISVATPPWTHAEISSAALARGIHVFTEKPMAMDLREARSMVDAADDAGRLLCVSHNFLYSRAVAKAKRFLGARPTLRYAAAIQLSSLRRRLPTWYTRLPAGLLFDEMPHLIYLMQYFLGPLEVEHVRGTGRSGIDSGAVEVLVRGERGPGQIAMVLDAPVSEWQVALVSDRGAVALDLFRDIAVRVHPDGEHKAADILRTSASMLGDHAAGFVASGARYLPGRLFWGHDVLIRKFLDAVLTGGPSPVSSQEALGVVEVAEKIVDSLSEPTAR